MVAILSTFLVIVVGLSRLIVQAILYFWYNLTIVSDKVTEKTID